MRTLIHALLSVMVSLEVATSPAQAMPGEDDSQPRVMVLDQPTTGATAPGSVYVAAGEHTTAAPLLLAGNHGAPIGADAATGFRRVFPLDENYRLDVDTTPWTLDVRAAFKHKAWAGNALFILSDLQDPEQAPVASHTVTALWQTAIPSGEQAAVRLVLDPEDGFHAGHTYRLRIVQLIAGKEIELTTGNLHLL